MSKKIKLLSCLLFIFMVIYGLNAGCSSEKLNLGINDDTSYVRELKTYRAGVETVEIPNVKVSEHVIIEGRTFNNKKSYVPDTPIAISTTDEKIAKILATYVSNNSYFAVVKGEAVGTAEVIFSGGSVTTPVKFGVSTASSEGNRAYIKFKNINNDPILVGSARQYLANYVAANGEISTSTSLIWSLPDEVVAKIASQGKDNAILQGIATGEVNLVVRDAENTVAAGVLIKVN